MTEREEERLMKLLGKNGLAHEMGQTLQIRANNPKVISLEGIGKEIEGCEELCGRTTKDESESNGRFAGKNGE